LVEDTETGFLVLPAHFVRAICLVAIGQAALAAGPAELDRCAAIESERERLQCFDAAAGRGAAKPAAEPLQQLGVVPRPEPAQGASSPTPVSERWELDPETKQGVWVVRPHQPLFFLPARYTNRTNDSPQSPTRPLAASAPLDSTEAEFQLSFKVKGAENLFGSNVDLWFGYTQESQWQVYHSDSAPFRETNYQPELFLSFPMRYELPGLTLRFVNLGLVHQSNGRAEPLSRSWDRLYAQFGFERGNFALLVRPWYRLKESADNDDNPDIVSYMGHGDVTAIYQWGRQQFSVLGRMNGGKATLQGTWSFPIQERLKGYVKLFSGYGETLIDYNWKQTTIGAGILLVDWL